MSKSNNKAAFNDLAKTQKAHQLGLALLQEVSYADGCNILAIQDLLRAGADIEAAPNGGRTALIEASFRGYTDAVEALIVAGANLEARDRDSFTPLMHASIGTETPVEDRIPLIRKLIAAGADVNARTDHGNSVLCLAVTNGAREEIVQLLLEHGADIRQKWDNGRSILELARNHSEGYYGSVVKLLEKTAENRRREDQRYIEKICMEGVPVRSIPSVPRLVLLKPSASGISGKHQQRL